MVMKRRTASLDGCKLDLRKELPLLFKAFDQAFTAYEKEIVQTPPEARARGFEASLLNSKMIQSIQSNFPINWKFGKYKRFTLRINGYIILFKKFNNKGFPMNIKTRSVAAISQQLSLPLFNELSFVAEPILFFGYKKDKMGNIIDPELIYIDEDNIKWTITNDEILTTKTKNIFYTKKDAMPKFSQDAINKKAGN